MPAVTVVLNFTKETKNMVRYDGAPAVVPNIYVAKSELAKLETSANGKYPQRVRISIEAAE